MTSMRISRGVTLLFSRIVGPSSLETDLATGFRESGMSKNACKKHCSKTARAMFQRGKAFGAMVAECSSRHIRLSIHASDNTDKLPMALLPPERRSQIAVTPWRNTPYLDGSNPYLSLVRKPKVGEGRYKYCRDNLGFAFLCADMPIYGFVGLDNEGACESHIRLESLYP